MENNIMNNPFHILRLPCTADQQIIIESAITMAQVVDNSTCNEAQSALLLISKRLEAEIDWFPGTVPTKISVINLCIDNLKPIPLDGLENIACINALLYNAATEKTPTTKSIIEYIKQIDQKYMKLTVCSIMGLLNKLHKEAQIDSITHEDAEKLLGYKKEEICKQLLDLWTNTKEVSHNEIALDLVKYYTDIDDKKEHVILSDLINGYVAFSKSLLDILHNALRICINRMLNISTKEIEMYDFASRSLSVSVKALARIALPLVELQINSLLEFPEFTVFIKEIIEACTSICDNMNNPTESLKIINPLIQYYGTLPEFSEGLSKAQRSFEAKASQENSQNAIPSSIYTPETSYKEDKTTLTKQETTNSNHAQALINVNESQEKSQKNATSSPIHTSETGSTIDKTTLVKKETIGITNKQESEGNKQIAAKAEMKTSKVTRNPTASKSAPTYDFQADKKYRVEVKGSKYAAPPFCTCCMDPTTNEDYIDYSRQERLGNRKYTRTISVRMPLCADCSEHSTSFSLRITIIGLLSILVGLCISLVSESFLIGFFSAMFFFLLLTALIKVDALPKNHSCRQKSVELYSSSLNDVRGHDIDSMIFTFTNPQYAQLFAAVNQSKVTELPYANSAKKNSMLRTAYDIVGHIIRIPLFFLMLYLLCYYIIFS